MTCPELLPPDLAPHQRVSGPHHRSCSLSNTSRPPTTRFGPHLRVLAPTDMPCPPPMRASSHACRCTFDYNSYRISSPEFQDLFLVELVTLLFEALFSFLIPNSQLTHRR